MLFLQILFWVPKLPCWRCIPYLQFCSLQMCFRSLEIWWLLWLHLTNWTLPAPKPPPPRTHRPPPPLAPPPLSSAHPSRLNSDCSSSKRCMWSKEMLCNKNELCPTNLGTQKSVVLVVEPLRESVNSTFKGTCPIGSDPPPSQPNRRQKIKSFLL